MMMHVRDCPGTTVSFDICPYPWCRKTKHLLYHLVSCEDPSTCEICNPTNISYNFRALKGLNSFRKIRIRQRFCTPCAPDAVMSSTNAEMGQSKSGGENQTVASSTNGKKSNNTKRTVKPPGVPFRSTKPVINGPSSKSNDVPVSKAPFTVPSPIPTIGDGSSSNTLKAHSASHLTRVDVPVSSYSINTISKPIKQSTRLLAGTANPLAVPNTATVIVTKITSPPNPLKGLPRDSPPESFSRSTAISHFPKLPTQINSDESLNSRKNESNSVEVQVDGSP